MSLPCRKNNKTTIVRLKSNYGKPRLAGDFLKLNLTYKPTEEHWTEFYPWVSTWNKHKITLLL